MTHRPNRYAVAPNVPPHGQCGILRTLTLPAADILIARLITHPCPDLDNPDDVANIVLRDIIDGLTRTVREMPASNPWRLAAVETLDALIQSPAAAHDLARLLVNARWHAARAGRATR